jgi:hypothetical protein
VAVVYRSNDLLIALAYSFGCHGKQVPLPIKLTSVSAIIPAFRQCLTSRCLAGVICVAIFLWSINFIQATFYNKLIRIA